MIQDILGWVSHYGYFAICAAMMMGIIGLPIPDETILVFSGYLCSTGRMHTGLALTAGYVGAISGISFSYLIGRYVGYETLRRYGKWIHLNDARLERLHAWFEKYGGWTLVFGYYIAGARHFTAIVAGTSRLEYPRFAAFAYPAALLWVTAFVTLGHVLGEHWQQALEVVHQNALRVSIALGVIVVLYVAWRIYRARRAGGRM